ncbi:hypothetical protein [Bacteroides pyogenes]|uniref:hypothetical protein n=1 Tax=Bacteroides pyogenes TaxID=310300 RepID=UPI0011E3BCD2|nr:hypothetical protein [Bacteroides pyogenes]TYK37826.1 hypothetical protein FNJ61_06330 [Bacteroides pyogenes]
MEVINNFKGILLGFSKVVNGSEYRGDLIENVERYSSGYLEFILKPDAVKKFTVLLESGLWKERFCGLRVLGSQQRLWKFFRKLDKLSIFLTMIQIMLTELKDNFKN